MNQHTTEELNALLKSEYNLLDEVGAITISPADLADAVLAAIDPGSVSPKLVALAALLELKQLARGVCRQRQTVAEHESEQGSLFDFQLQSRYPAEREGDDVYILRQHLTLAERQQNINRLRSEANAKLAHADALQAETDRLIHDGVLVEAAA